VTRHQGRSDPRSCLKNVLTAKKGRFGRKTGVGGERKIILFCTFPRFVGFLRLQVFVRQNLPEHLPFQKNRA
jgi:hypothetical protein